MEKNKETILLFDVDGTLTKSRNVIILSIFSLYLNPFQKKIEQDMIDVLQKLQSKYYVGVIGGSDRNKVIS